MAIKQFISKAKVWNKDHFGNIFLKKKLLKAWLKGIQVALTSKPSDFLVDLEKRLLGEYANISKIEEEFWAMKSRINLLVQGDKNMTFFHTFVLVRKRQNELLI